MGDFTDKKSILNEYEKIKCAYDKMKQEIFEKCPECGQTIFKDLFQNAGSAIAVLDNNGNTLLSNAAFEEITGFSIADTFGYPMYELLMPENDLEGQEYLKKLFKTLVGKVNLSLSIPDKQNNLHYVDLTVSSVPSVGHTNRSTICIFNDVTSERESEMHQAKLIEELTEAKELQEDNAAQLAMLLHELDIKNFELEKEIAERKKAEEKLKESEERFKILSITDQLTGLFNRRHMVDVAERKVQISEKENSALSFILMDIDDFKDFNDTYGHAAGDDVLENVGKVIKKTTRSTDWSFRYGGEEFLIILPSTDGQEATQVAEKIRKAVAAEKYQTINGELVKKTMSIGVAQFIPGESLEKVLKRADDNMYNSKIKGKNRVYFSD